MSPADEQAVKTLQEIMLPKLDGGLALAQAALDAATSADDAAVIINDKQEKAAAAETPAPSPPAEDGDRDLSM